MVLVFEATVLKWNVCIISKCRKKKKKSKIHDLLLYLPITPTMYRFCLFIYLLNMLLKANLLQPVILYLSIMSEFHLIYVFVNWVKFN